MKFFLCLLILFSDLLCQDDGINKNVGHAANDFSHVAILGVKRDYGVHYEGLGSLINKRYVLIPAWFAYSSIVEVVLGVHKSFEELVCTGDHCPAGKVPSINYLLCFSTSFLGHPHLKSSQNTFFGCWVWCHLCTRWLKQTKF